MAYEVITTTDKAKRDEMFQDLKRNGNHMERQVVKFSGVESYEGIDATEDGIGWFEKFRSTWSVAYPATPDVKPTRRARLRRQREDSRRAKGSFENLRENLKEVLA